MRVLGVGFQGFRVYYLELKVWCVCFIYDLPLQWVRLRNSPCMMRTLPGLVDHSRTNPEQLLRRNAWRLRGEPVFKAHRLLYHSTLGSRVIKKKRRYKPCAVESSVVLGTQTWFPDCPGGFTHRLMQGIYLAVWQASTI